MAEHMGDQFGGVTKAKRSTPLPGTEKHPQGRLFAPVGGYAGDPWKLSPENWMPTVKPSGLTRGPDTVERDDEGLMRRVPGMVESTKPQVTPAAAHGDITSWHSSTSSAVPRYDDPDSRQIDQYEHEGPDWDNSEIDPETGDYNDDYVDFSVDHKDRPMANYGSAVGMHLGDIKAATDRDSARDFIHPLRIPRDTLAPPPRGNFSTDRPGGSIAAGSMRSQNRVLNQETGERTEDTRWSDQAANFASRATDLVESGKTLAYRNDIEAAGSTSYRTLPETTRTWSEDVLGSTTPGGRSVPGESADTEHGLRGTPHPALVHLAQQGYNPVVNQRETPRIPKRDQAEVQQRLGFEDPHGRGDQAPEVRQRLWEGHDLNAAASAREEAFNSGRLWSLRKPKDEEAF